MTVPYTVTTPEYVAWAKRGEELGKSEEVFTKSISDLDEVINKGIYNTSSYYDARYDLEELFNLEDS